MTYHPYPETYDLQRKLQKLLTTQVVAKRFRVTPMTIFNWRALRGMPHIEMPGKGRPAIRFVWDDVEVWANKEGIRIPGRRVVKFAAGALLE